MNSNKNFVILEEAREEGVVMRKKKADEISMRIFTLLQFYGVNAKTLAKMLRISETSVYRWKKGENIGKVHRLITLHFLEETMVEARSALKKGDEKKWFHAKNELLEGLSPIECIIQTSDGFGQVKTLLNAIRYGFPS